MKNLAKAICQVMAAASHVQKTGNNSFHGYAYASDADLLRVIQPAMAKAELAMVPTQVGQVDKQLDKGKVQTDVHVQYTLVHSSGESMTVQAIGRGIDKEDKGPYKAMTGALKYALRQTFLVPTGDDPEVHSVVHDTTQDAPKPKPKAKPRPQSKAKPKPKAAPPGDDDGPDCPKCGGPMHDFSDKRRAGGRAPAYKCKSGHYNSATRTTEGCDGVVWDPIESGRKNPPARSVFSNPFDDEVPF